MAEHLHGTESVFIPPFPGSISKYLSPASAFHKRHGKIIPFIATRNGQPVGRIAAIINRSHNEYYKDRTGFFGFFECENNVETARALLEIAEDVLRKAGMESVRGPYSPSINDECGLLVNCFDVPPCVGLTWNPQYYKGLLEAAGYSSARTLHGLNLPMHRLPQPARFARIVDRIKKNPRLKVRPLDLSRLNEELEIVRDVYNSTLERNWGFVPISMEDLLGAADDIRAIANPKLLLVAEMDGKNAGVGLTLPNFNEILIRIKKTPHWLRLPHILWLMKTKKINSCRQTVLGVVPGCRDRGLHAWLMHENFVRAQEIYSNATLGWIEDNNTEILEHSAAIGAEPQRNWEIFQKKLSA